MSNIITKITSSPSKPANDHKQKVKVDITKKEEKVENRKEEEKEKEDVVMKNVRKKEEKIVANKGKKRKKEDEVKKEPPIIKKKKKRNSLPDGVLKRCGTRVEVFYGSALQTKGGLKKSDLKLNGRGRIVSIKASNVAKKLFESKINGLYKGLESVKTSYKKDQ